MLTVRTLTSGLKVTVNTVEFGLKVTVNTVESGLNVDNRYDGVWKVQWSLDSR